MSGGMTLEQFKEQQYKIWLDQVDKILRFMVEVSVQDVAKLKFDFKRYWSKGFPPDVTACIAFKFYQPRQFKLKLKEVSDGSK